jgi:choline monooxygenase
MANALSNLLSRFDPTLPLDCARTIPAAWYFDSDLAEMERLAVFAGWQAVARTDQLTKPGEFATADVAGEPFVVLRDEGNNLRAFHNVCRHRAAVVMPEPFGTVDRLRCRYHGWTYDLQGRLRGLPEFDGVCDFPRDNNGLIPLAVDVWGPTVWVHPGTPSFSLQEYLKPLPTQCNDISALKWSARKEYEVACNWKAYVDNYLDGGYHVNTVHPGLAGVLDYTEYRTELFDHGSVQISPIVSADDVPASAVRTGMVAQYWWIFPNFMVNIYQGVMDTNVVLPLGPDRCKVIFDFYFADQPPDYILQSIEVADRVQLEDMEICAEVQRGLRSRTYDTGRYSVKREAGVYQFHRMLHQSLISDASHKR